VRECSGDSKHVDAPVGIEVLVLNGDDSLSQDRSEVVIVDNDSALERKRADDAALDVVQVGHRRRPVAFEVVNLREVDGEDEQQSGQRSRYDGKEQKDCKGQLAGNFWPTIDGNRLGLKAVGTAETARFDRSDWRSSHALQASSTSPACRKGMPQPQASMAAEWGRAKTNLCEPRIARA